MARMIHGVIVDYRSAEESYYHDYDSNSDLGSASRASEGSLKGCKVLLMRTASAVFATSGTSLFGLNLRPFMPAVFTLVAVSVSRNVLLYEDRLPSA